MVLSVRIPLMYILDAMEQPNRFVPAKVQELDQRVGRDATIEAVEKLALLKSVQDEEEGDNPVLQLTWLPEWPAPPYPCRSPLPAYRV